MYSCRFIVFYADNWAAREGYTHKNRFKQARHRRALRQAQSQRAKRGVTCLRDHKPLNNPLKRPPQNRTSWRRAV